MNKPFLSPKESKEFNKSVNSFISDMCDQKMSLVSSPENRYTLHHGTSFTFSSIDNTESSLTKHSITIEYKYEDVKNYKIEQLYNFIDNFIEQMSSQMMQTIYQTIGASCDKIGNVIDVKKEKISIADAFLETLRKVEFGVDKHGKVTIPQIHIHPSQAKFIEELQAQDETYQQLIQDIQKEKSEQAIQKEKYRLAQFEGISFE